jgi:hypothetical protein
VVYGPVRLIRDARDLALTVLSGLPHRWRHTMGVARRAEAVSVVLDSTADAQLLVAAAWLHDIGYAPALHATGFHPLDGARYLRDDGWPTPIAALVAYHSGAAEVAAVRGLAGELADFPQPAEAIGDVLTYADQTIGPDGTSVTFAQRLTDMLRRHGPDSANAVAHARREPALRAAINRVDQRLATRGEPSYS